MLTTLLRRRVLPMIALVALTASFALGQTTVRPRLLFTPQTKAALQAKVLAAGTQSNAAFNSMVSSAGLQTSGPPSASNQLSYVFMRSMRRMTEVAFRYQMTGNTAYGDGAKALMMAAVNYLVPNASAIGSNTGPVYQGATYAASIGITFDMVYDRMSAAERATVVSHLEAWITSILNGYQGWASYSQYTGAADNGAFGWTSSLAMALMAIYGDSNYPNLLGHLNTALGKIRDGWLDAVSPDGSVDEGYGYYNYGVMSSLNAALAAENFGLGNVIDIDTTNIVRTPRWMGASVMGDTFNWVGDSSPSHKGLRMDPILYAVINRIRNSDPETARIGLTALQKIESLEPLGDGTVTMGYSPWVNKAIHFPEGLATLNAANLSSFFRDNANQAPASSNRLSNYSGVGTGGAAFLHNTTQPGENRLGVYYRIRDEWMNHQHEDDGHVSIAIDGKHQFLDPGRGGTTSAQSTRHNIVAVAGAPGFDGNSTNYYNPPGPDGRFHGMVETRALGEALDHVRGSHNHMWMMNDRADRSVTLVKDPVNPYVLVVSNVKKDSSSHTYEELWNTAAAVPSLSSVNANGTQVTPMQVTNGGKTSRTVYLSPASTNIVYRGVVAQGGLYSYRYAVQASGVDVSFVSVHARTAPTAVTPLVNPTAQTAGGVMSWSFGATDRVLVSKDGSGAGDDITTTDGRLVMVRETGSTAGIDSWFATEATSVTHNGQSLLSTNGGPAMTVAVRMGRVEITTANGAGASGLNAAIEVPFGAPSVVVVDGQAVSNFSMQGSVLVFGSVPTLPQLSSDDRFYHFEDGSLDDLVANSNVLLTASGRLTSTGGWATVQLKSGSTFDPIPLSLGMGVQFLPGAYGTEVMWRIESTLGAADLMEVKMFPDNGMLGVQVRQQGVTLGTTVVPLNATGVMARYNLIYDPVAGMYQVMDPLGTVLLQGPMNTYGQPFHVRALASHFAEIDGLSAFSSAEDGVTPQGVVFWTSPMGRAGYVVNTPQILSFQTVDLLFDFSPVPAWAAAQWHLGAGVYEAAATPYVQALNGSMPSSIRELCFESTQVAIPPVSPGQSMGVSVINSVGQELTGAKIF